MHMVFTFMITLQKFREIRRQPKFRTLTKSHTEEQSERRIVKNQAMAVMETPLVCEATEIVCNSISNLYVKRLPQELSGSRTLHLCPSLCHSHLCL